MDKNYYIFYHFNQIVKDLGKAIDVNFLKVFIILG